MTQTYLLRWTRPWSPCGSWFDLQQTCWTGSEQSKQTTWTDQTCVHMHGRQHSCEIVHQSDQTNTWIRRRCLVTNTETWSRPSKKFTMQSNKTGSKDKTPQLHWQTESAKTAKSILSPGTWWYDWNVQICVWPLQRGPYVHGLYNVDHMCMASTTWTICAWPLQRGPYVYGLYNVDHMCMASTTWTICAWPLQRGPYVHGLYNVDHMCMASTTWTICHSNLKRKQIQEATTKTQEREMYK